MGATDKNKPSRQDRLRKILSGLSLHLQSTASITFGGVAHPVADLLAQIQKDITATDDTDKARAAWLQAVQRARDSHLQVDPVLGSIKQYVMLQYGNTQSASTTLADFGYSPRKVPTVKPATQVASAAKAKATRTARHTMGTQQKKEVTGTIETIVTTPPAPTAPPVAPSPVASVPTAGAPVAGAAPHAS
jgi:hypothetical protein